MKRATKILTLILIVVFVLGVFASCDWTTGKDVAKYRATTVMDIGNETVSIGKLLDTFNSYYNNYYYYISYGMMTIDDLFEMVIAALQQQYMQVDDYVSTHEPVSPQFATKARHAEYLTEAEFEYCIKYVRYVSFTSFDSNLEAKLAAKRELNDPETEDTSRDFPEPDKILGEGQSYAEHLFMKNFDDEELMEYFDKYYGEGLTFEEVDINSYVYQSAEDAQARLDEINDRIEEEADKVDFDELQAAQESVLKQYRETIKTNYGITMDEFVVNQLNDMVSSCILAKWSYEVYKDLDNDEELQARMEADFAEVVRKQVADFNLNEDSFDSFITSLSSSSYLYNVPEKNQGQYVFVKNILIPFTSDQSNLLKDFANQKGGTDSDEYIDMRNAEAANILAEYFFSDKYDEDIESKYFTDKLTENDDEDSDSKYELLSGLFTYTGGTLAINSDPDNILGQFFADGKVKNMEGKTSAETVIELMKRFNTDTAQHSAQYDYVVYVGEDWEDYEHSWVEEFYTAVNEVVQANKGDIKDRYALCVSSYGVHIIYIEGYVEDFAFSQFNWQDRTDPTSNSYRWFKSDYENLVSEKTDDQYKELVGQYIEAGKLTVTGEFKKFLEDNEFSFDFDLFLEELKKEYNN